MSDEFDSDQSSMHSGSLAPAPLCVLEGTIGVPDGHRAAVSPLDLKTSEEGFAPYLRESMKTDRHVLLTTEEGTLSSELIEGLEWRGFGGKIIEDPIYFLSVHWGPLVQQCLTAPESLLRSQILKN